MIWSLASKLLYRIKLKPFLKILQDPMVAQEKRLQELLQYAKGTTYGKRYGFSDIDNYEEFVDRIPVNQYKDFQPYIQQELKGINNTLYPEPIDVVLTTSGSSGEPKLIPQTLYATKSVNRFRILTFAAAANIRPFLHGKILAVVAPAVYKKIGKWEVGYGSGHGMKGGNRLLRSKVVPHPDVFDISDWEVKFREIIRQGVNTPKITACVGITSFVLSLLRRTKYESYNWLMNDIEVSSKAKRRVQTALTDDRSLDLRVLWPQLSVIYHSGVVRDLYEPMIYELAGDVHIHEVYGGTEACYGFQLHGDMRGVVPLVNELFFEFAEECEGPLPHTVKTIPLSEVKVNKPYRIIITTPTSLWRYDLHDLVMFTSLDPLTMRCLGKSKNVLNLSGEKVSEQQISAALTIASEEQEALACEYMVAPHVSVKGAQYHLFVEFTRAPAHLGRFTNAFETALQEISELYYHVRNAGTVNAAIIHQVPSGSFEAYEFERLQSSDSIIGQTKMPRITSLDNAHALLQEHTVSIST